MNFIDIGILLILAITILGGYYRGFISTALNIGATLVSFLIARLSIPLLANAIQGRDKLFNMMLYYTEGSEYVAITDVELTRTPISSLSYDTLRTVIQNAGMPRPMDSAITRNIATEAFSADGITTLGDYFNQTIVCVVINIISLLLVFLVLRIVCGFLIRGADFGCGGFPVLQRADGPIGAGLGLINGVLLLFIVFLVMPILLTVLPKFYDFLGESFFGEFFYKANPFLLLIPAT
ncbi:MAG: CvpA family protein [Clostridia bacterium]